MMFLLVAGNAHGMRVDLATRAARLEFKDPVDFLASHRGHQLIGKLLASKGVSFSTERTK